jgi:creatinine amidohydrolase
MFKDITIACAFLFIGLLSGPLCCQTEEQPLVLQEMTWVEVKEYLQTSDMVIVPLGSTEQHGPHLPLGTDFFEAFEISKKISAKTGVVVAPVVMVGYSSYHSGFTGTLSLTPETMEAVLFECVEYLIKYGFRKIMFFNYHGGNNIVQDMVIHRINRETEAIAFAIGVGSSLHADDPDEDFFDWHAGLSETSLMLYLKPELVRTELIEQPDIHFTARMKALKVLADDNPDLEPVWHSLFGVPSDTGKGGASHELSSNGIWSFSDVTSASTEIGEEAVDNAVERIAHLIDALKTVKGE